MTVSQYIFRQNALGDQDAYREKAALQIPISIFASLYDNGYSAGKPDFCYNDIATYGELVLTLYEHHRNRVYPSKASAPLFCPTMYNGSRALLNSTTSGMLVLDSDGMIQINDLVRLFTGDSIEAIIYTSASNQAGERCRLVVPLATTITTEDYTRVIKSLVDYVGTLNPAWKTAKASGLDGLDTSKMSPCSMFYVPGQYRCAGQNEFHLVDGHVLTAADWLTAFPQPIEKLVPPPPTKHPALRGEATQPIEPSKRYATNDDDRLAKCIAALAVISPDIDRDRWLNVGKVLKDEFGDSEGFSLWDDWSRGSAKYNAREMNGVWRSFHRPKVVTIGTLFKYADDSDRSWRTPFMKVIDRFGDMKGYDSPEQMRQELLGKKERTL